MEPLNNIERYVLFSFKNINSLYIKLRIWKIGKSKLRWGGDVIQKDMKEAGVQKEDAQDQRTWRIKTQSADPK